MGQPEQHASGDQFYVTHCNVNDSVLNNPGYTVRASSATEPAALDAAFHYPPYELPIDLWKDLPPVGLAPRRLARTNHPNGGVWAVQSCYLAKDTVDRDRSYFSHLLALPEADPAAVLRSWGADGWTNGYPLGASKSLPGAKLPVGTLVSDASLTAFLGEEPFGPTALSVTVCPSRLRENATARREVFARMLQALLLLAEEENELRRRLYVHAEPGLVALLLYGAVRLLPPVVTNDLTFSTFEAYHRNIRDYKLAEVVGTYLGTPDKGLDADLGTTRGIALDTFTASRSSPELRAAGTPTLPAGVSDLIDLATAGDWNLLPAVKHAVGADPSGLPKAGKALARARGLARIEAGGVTIDELLALQEDKVAAEELKSRADEVWPVIKAAALTRQDARAAFRDILAEPNRLKELWEEAVEAVLNEDFRKWDARWTVIRGAAGADEAKKLLNKLVGSEKNEAKLSKLPTDIRNKLRLACADVGLFPSRPLLVPIGLGELETLIGAQPSWAGYTAFVLMAEDRWNWLPHVPPSNRAQMRKRAREYLFAAPPAAIASYVHAARSFLDTDSTFLATLFAPYSEKAAKLMDGLLTSEELEPSDWMKLCEAVGLTRDAWGEFLLENNRLANLLCGLGGDGVGKDVWDAYLSLLTPALISPDLIEVEGDDDAVTIHEWERAVHAHLRDAAARLTAADVRLKQALPDGGVARLFAANALVKWVDNPASIPHDAPDEVPHACDAFEVDRLGLVRAAYKKAEYDQLSLPEDAEKLAPVVDLFRACFPVDASFNTARRAATEVIRLSADCPAQSRGVFQAHFIFSCIPDLHYSTLLEDDRRHQLEPFAVARIQERLAKPAKKVGPRYVPPGAPAGAAEAVPVEAPFEDEDAPDEDAEPVIEKTRKTGRKAPYKKAKKSGCMGLVLFLFALGAICAIVARVA